MRTPLYRRVTGSNNKLVASENVAIGRLAFVGLTRSRQSRLRRLVGAIYSAAQRSRVKANSHP